MSTISKPPAQHLSLAAFEASVAELAPRVAVFDCDGTLWSRDSGSAFMEWSKSSGLLDQTAIAWLDERYERYRRGEVSELTICGEMVQVYQGLSVETLRSAARTFFACTIEAHIFPEMQALVERLQSAGTEIWAVSSTNDWVVEEGVRRFNIARHRVLAARVACVDGLVTDHVLDVPTDEGKVKALAHSGITAPDAVFGNSIHDAAMLRIARRAFPINPSRSLEEESARRGWPVFFPASVRAV